MRTNTFKWFWLVLLAVVVMRPVNAYSQAATFPTQPQVTLVLPATASTGTTAWLNLSQANAQDVHYWTMTWYTFTAVGIVPTCQVKVQQSIDQSSVSDLIANQVCTTTGTVSTSATAETNYVRINLGTKSGTGTVLVIANGYRQNPFGTVAVSGTITPSGTQNVNLTQVASQPTATNGNGVAAVAGAASSGLIVTVAACSGSTCYTSPVNSGLTVIASGSTSTLFSATTMLTGMHCNNQTASAVNFTLTDGNNAYVIGPNFSIPASSFLDLPTGLIGAITASGLKSSAGTATAVNCWFSGKQ